MLLDESMTELRARLSKARSLTVLTGAGVSADSGIPTFRGKEGLWNNFRAEDLATPQAFSRDPRLVWEWYDWRRRLIASKTPNAAHMALVDFEDRIPRFTLLTQNVDGFHRKAGNRNIIELHGNIWETRCLNCAEVLTNFEVPLRIPPSCSNCGGLVRPNIVWFGESLDPGNMDRSLKALEQCDLLLVIGTSGVVQPAASFAEIAGAAGAFIIEVNLDPAAKAGATHAFVQGRAAEMIPRLL